MRTGIVIRSLMFAVVLLAFAHGAFGQIGISVGFGPPLWRFTLDGSNLEATSRKQFC
jgi:hypothetical protein